MAFLEPVEPGDIAGQHAGIGRLDIAGNEGQPNPVGRPHAKALQHMDMGMAATDKHKILGDRNGLSHRSTMPEQSVRRHFRSKRTRLGPYCASFETPALRAPQDDVLS